MKDISFIVESLFDQGKTLACGTRKYFGLWENPNL